MGWDGMGCDGMGWDGNYPYYPNNRLFFKRDHTPTLEVESEWQLPLLPQLPSVF